MELEFPGFIALLLVIAALSAPISGLKLTTSRLDQMAQAMAATRCAPVVSDLHGSLPDMRKPAGGDCSVHRR